MIQNRNQGLLLLFLTFVCLNILDYLLTAQALRRGAVEAGVWKAEKFETSQTMMLKLMILPLIVAAFYLYASTVREGTRRIFDLVALFIPLWYLAIVVNNIIQYPRSDEDES